jgi:hypothetical protein
MAGFGGRIACIDEPVRSTKSFSAGVGGLRVEHVERPTTSWWPALIGCMLDDTIQPILDLLDAFYLPRAGLPKLTQGGAR